MPPSRPYDYPILLNDTFVPNIGKIYPLSPDEQKATDDFIEENLRTGKIRPFSSLQASSFFYVGKKDSGLWTLPRLSIFQWRHHQRCIPTTSYLQPHQYGQRCHHFYKIQYLIQIQQYLDQRGRSMEGHLHYIERIIQTNCHVFWTIQLPCHIPEIHEWLVQRYDSWRMANCLYGWYADHCIWWRNKFQMNKESLSENLTSTSN